MITVKTFTACRSTWYIRVITDSFSKNPLLLTGSSAVCCCTIKKHEVRYSHSHLFNSLNSVLCCVASHTKQLWVTEMAEIWMHRQHTLRPSTSQCSVCNLEKKKKTIELPNSLYTTIYITAQSIYINSQGKNVELQNNSKHFLCKCF